MEQFHITLSENDVDYFERKRAELGMTKSAFVRLLISNYENAVPGFIKYKEVIDKQSELNNLVKQIIIDKNFKTEDKIYLKEKFNELERIINEKVF